MGHGKALVGRDVVLLGVGILLAAVFGISPAVATNPDTQSSSNPVPKGLELHVDLPYYNELLRILQTPFHGKYMRQSVSEVQKLFANNPDFINKEFTPRLMYYMGRYSEKFHDRLGDILLYYYKEYPHRNNPGSDVWKEPNQNEIITSRFLDFYIRARGLTKSPPPLRPNTGFGMGTSTFDFLFDASGAIMPPSRPAPVQAPMIPFSFRFETIPASTPPISTAEVQIASTIQEEPESNVVSVTDSSADVDIDDYYSAYSSFDQDAIADEMATSDDQNILADDNVCTISPSSIDTNLADSNDGLRPCISDPRNANPITEDLPFSTQIRISNTEYGLESFLSDAAKADPVPDDLTYSDSDYGLDQLFPDALDAVSEDDNASFATEMDILNSDYSPEHFSDIRSTEPSPDCAISVSCVGTNLDEKSVDDNVSSPSEIYAPSSDCGIKMLFCDIESAETSHVGAISRSFADMDDGLEQLFSIAQDAQVSVDEHQPLSDSTEKREIAHYFESDDQRAQSNVNDAGDPVGNEPAPDLQSNEPDPNPNSDLAMSEMESLPELSPSSNHSDPIHETIIQPIVDRHSLHDCLHPELISPVDGQPLTTTEIVADLHGFPDPDALNYQWSTEIGMMVGIFGILTLTVALLLFTETKVMPISLENFDIEPREFHYTMANGAKIRVHTGIPDRSIVTF